ncbi:MAG TPA: hypothetical protein VK171_17235 [Fimbriimonas sp.]|nr:hypothetical protein [Fimbriimonas sp.]
MYHGWFGSFDGQSLEFQTKMEKKPVQGDYVYAEADTFGLVLRFVCQVVTNHCGRMWLKVCSPVEERKQSAEPRIQIEHLEGKLEQGTTQAEIVVIDASENGFGFVTHTPLERMESKANLASHFGAIEMTIDVRHIRKLSDQGCFRGGVRLVAIDRVARARWTRVIGAMMEAA